MFEYEDIETIYSTVAKYLDKYKEVKEKELNLSNVILEFLEENYKNYKKVEIPLIFAEDGGNINGVIGSCSYIFAKAVCVTEKRLYKERPIFYLLPFYSSEYCDIEEFSNLVMKNLEYYTVYNALLKQGDISNSIVLFDGSFLADIFKLKGFVVYHFKEEKIKNILNEYENLLLEHPMKIYEEILREDKLDENLIPAVYISYILNFLRVLCLIRTNNIYAIYFVKRPISSKLISELISSKIKKNVTLTDIEILKNFAPVQFVTKIFNSDITFTTKLLQNEQRDKTTLSKLYNRLKYIIFSFIEPLLKKDLAVDMAFIHSMVNEIFKTEKDISYAKYYFLYYRLSPTSQIYKIEIPQINPLNVENLRNIILTILNEHSVLEGYPYLLLYAHRVIHIDEKIKSMLENLIASLDKEKILVSKDATKL